MKAPTCPRPFRLSRRALLRGSAGLGAIGVALPALDAMMDGRGHWYRGAHAAVPPEPRLITYFFPNGWGNGGDEYTIIPRFLREGPLAPHAADLVTVANMNKREWGLNQNFTSDAHARGHATFATGVGVDAGGAGGPSIDQIAAQKFGDTRLRSLPVAIGTARGPHNSHISWTEKNVPVPAERDPVVLFQRLFGAATPAPAPGTPAPAKSLDVSVLDFVRADAARLRARVGNADKARIDQHLTAVRDLEKSIFAPVAAGCTAPAAPSAMTDKLSNERAQVMMRLLVIALQCDITRYASFQLAHRGDARQFPWLGIVAGGYVGTNFENGHHGISHDGSAVGRERMNKICLDQTEQFAFFLNLLKTTRDGTGTLLDSSLVFFASETQNSGGHLVHRMTTILAGKANGRLAGGREIDGTGQPYANVLCSVLNLAGVPTEKFGIFGTGRIPGL
jgi:hypothetical protein